MRIGRAGLALVILALVFFGAGAVSYFVGAGGETVRVEIKNDSVDEVGRVLRDARVLTPWKSFVFAIVSGAGGAARSFHPGIFLIPRRASVRQIIRILSAKGRVEVTATIPEGSSLREVAVILLKAGLIENAESFLAITGQPAQLSSPPKISPDDFPFLKEKPGSISLEGYLFPDTYRFFADARPEEIARKLLATFEKKNADFRETAGRSGFTFHEILTLASIVESEVRSDEDRRLVADIFSRRLKAGIPLQADSTVNYVSGKKSVFTSAAARAADNPWNTYKYRGLPPGPIGNPGSAAIRAVLERKPNVFWYFLTAPDGKVYYARTLEEHVLNKKNL
ncbi:endolytic transglycosylase MltG [Patescibacteria group bacterium]|nr:MAG: endolytic transglycosylase MltG [Patescibacteria group bacterium]